MRVSILKCPAGFILFTLLAACSAGTRETPVEIRFGTAGDVTLRSLQFYLYDIELLDEKGVAHPLRLAGPVALIDLAGDPATARAPALRGSIAGAPQSNYRAIRFTVGVPFELNHANPLTASAPLDRGDLFWTWQTGYKFLRADYLVDGTEASFHLGSTGCSSVSALRPPVAPCAQPNRMRVELAGDPLKNVVRLHPGAFGTGACTGDYAHDPACANGYAATALQPASGQCADSYCAAQTLWSLD